MGRLTFPSRHRRLVVGISLLLLPVSAWGQSSAAQRATLKGINTVEVVVEAIDPVAEQDGLTRSQLQTDIEERLRQAGITVGPTLTGHLYVNVDTVKGDRGQTYAYNVSVQYVQQVVLARDPKAPIFAPTWDTGGVGIVAASRLREVRQDVANYVDQFIKAHLEQNPKPERPH
jgi:hypothetical protein